MQAEPYHGVMKRKHSSPSREVDDFEDDENVIPHVIARMHAFESTTALSLLTPTLLLTEFVARLDHLVEAAEKLTKMARFKQQLTI